MGARHPRDDEFVTIIGGDMDEITRAFRAQGLSEREYAIVGQVGRHHFTRVEGGRSETLFDGQRLIAATYRRRGPP